MKKTQTEERILALLLKDALCIDENKVVHVADEHAVRAGLAR
jgi:hypothetical protein